MKQLPKLIPIEAPWHINPSTPYLRMNVAEAKHPTTVMVSCTFKRNQEQLLQVELNFGQTLHARIAPSYSDSEVIRENDFDWSAVPDFGFQDPTKFHEEWSRTEVCPDPGMYEVVGSSWLVACDKMETLRHFIVLGHDAYIEVLAKSWSWRLWAP